MTPHPLSASPPTGLAGTANGCGGSPALGTSEASTAGGVDTLYGQLLGSVAGAGSATAIAGAPAMNSAVATTAARRALLKVAMEVQVKRRRPRNGGAAL
jgi:hypothetical protein